MTLPVVQDRTQAPQIVRQHLNRPLEACRREITLTAERIADRCDAGPYTGEVPVGQLDTVEDSLRYVCGGSSHQIRSAAQYASPRMMFGIPSRPRP
jgi:hypothetical protein